MRLRSRLFLAAALLVLGATGCGTTSSGDEVAATDDGLTDIGAGLEGLPGLSASVYAEGLENVAALAVDGTGRVFAATASYADDGTDAVYLLPDAGADPVILLEGVHTPLGLLWHEDELYVASAERIDAYGGFDGTSFGTQRTVIALPSGVGEANGLALGSDGRLMVGISAPCDVCEPELEESGAVLSVGTDGTNLAVVASGIRAPIGLAYFPGTDDLFVTMNQRDDLEDETPGDWLAVVSAGQDWGFPECYGQDTATCAEVPEPVAVLDEHAAVSGVAFVVDTGSVPLGDLVGTAALVAEWSRSEVKAVQLTADGDTYDSRVTTFLTGLTNPVPVLSDRDGSILVGDWGTGTVYRITAS